MKIARTTARPASFSARKLRQEEGESQRHGGERVAEVVDEVGKQRDRVRHQEDGELQEGRNAEDGETDCNRLDALAGANDRAIDEAMRMAVLSGRAVAVTVLDVVSGDCASREWR